MEKLRVSNEGDKKATILLHGLSSLKFLAEELRSCSIDSSLHANRLYNLNVDIDQKDHDDILSESQNVASSAKCDSIIEQEISYIKAMIEFSINDVKSVISKIKNIV